MKITSLSFKINTIGVSICLIFIFVCSSALYFAGKKYLNHQYKEINTFLSVLFEQKREELANEIFARQNLALNSSVKDIIKVNGITKAVIYNKKGDVLLSLRYNPNHEHTEQQSVKQGKNVNFALNNKKSIHPLSENQMKLLDKKAVFLTDVQGMKGMACYSNAIEVIGDRVGYVTIYYNIHPVKQHVIEIIIVFSLFVLLLAIFMSFFISFSLSYFIVKPILKLKKTMGKVEKGVLGAKVDLDSNDEIGEIGSAFNKMSEKLLQNNTALEMAVKAKEDYALKLARANAALKNLNTGLELIVKKRTSELLKTNTRLKREIEEKEKMKEDLLRIQKLESIGLLAGGIAHDFNNILGVIIGNLSLARAYAEKDQKIAKYLADTEQSCFRARDLTNQLLTFSRGGAPVKKLISMPEFIEESIVFVLRGSGVGHELSIVPDLFDAEIDKGQINQVLNNIIINAIQAMHNNGVISIKAENYMINPDDTSLPLKPGNYIKISIKDQGEGICEKNLHNIFDPYFTTKQNGNGLGLAMVHSIIKRHDGYISVESIETKGTIFRIYLPASMEKFKPKAGESEISQQKVSEKHGNTGKILVMDDDEMIRDVVGDMLIHMGHEVEFSTDGAEACRKYTESMEKNDKFDLIIMDLTIPGGMGGKQAVKKILEIDPEAKVVVSSGYSNDPVMADYQSYGFSGVVVKPFQMEELKSMIQGIIGR